MKDLDEAVLRESEGVIVSRGETLERVEFCLRRLFRARNVAVEAELVPGLTFEELLGALISAEHWLGEEISE
jgi:hypothetical protein